MYVLYSAWTCVYIYIYIYIYDNVYIYIYIHRPFYCINVIMSGWQILCIIRCIVYNARPTSENKDLESNSPLP